MKIAEDRTLAFDLCVEAEVLSFSPRIISMAGDGLTVRKEAYRWHLRRTGT